jgi:mannose-6-phosphate isomerase
MSERRKQGPAPTLNLQPLSRRIEKPWGWEIVWAECASYTGKLIHIRAGLRLSLQYHDQKLETQCLLSGRAILVAEGADGSLHEVSMEKGLGYTVQPFQRHRLIAIEDSEIIEVSTAETGTTVRLEDDYLRANETEAVRTLPNRGWAADPRIVD